MDTNIETMKDEEKEPTFTTAEQIEFLNNGYKCLKEVLSIAPSFQAMVQYLIEMEYLLKKIDSVSAYF